MSEHGLQAGIRAGLCRPELAAKGAVFQAQQTLQIWLQIWIQTSAHRCLRQARAFDTVSVDIRGHEPGPPTRLCRCSGFEPLLSFLQVQAAAQEYQREFAAKDAAIQALNSEVEALQDLLHSQLENARTAARVTFVPLNLVRSTRVDQARD